MTGIFKSGLVQTQFMDWIGDDGTCDAGLCQRDRALDGTAYREAVRRFQSTGLGRNSQSFRQDRQRVRIDRCGFSGCIDAFDWNREAKPLGEAFKTFWVIDNKKGSDGLTLIAPCLQRDFTADARWIAHCNRGWQNVTVIPRAQRRISTNADR